MAGRPAAPGRACASIASRQIRPGLTDVWMPCFRCRAGRKGDRRVYSFFPAAVALLFLGYGIYVIRQSGANRVSLSFFLVCLGTFFWQFAWAVLFQVEDPQAAALLVRIGWLPIVFLPTSLYHFLAEITGRRQELVGVYISYAIAAALALTLFVSDLLITGYYEYFFGYYPRAGVLHPLHVLQTVVVVLRGLYITWRAQKAAPPRMRIRLRYCVTSLLIYLFAAVDYLCNYGLEFYPPGVLPLSISLGLLAVATVKHQLMDVSVALTRGLARLVTLGLLVFLYVGGFFLLDELLPQRPVLVELVFGLMFLVFVGEVYGPVRQLLQDVPERLIRGGRSYPSAQVLQAVGQALSTHINVADMARNLEQVLVSQAEISPVTLFIREDFEDAPSGSLQGDFVQWNIERGRLQRSARLLVNDPFVVALKNSDGVLYQRELESPNRIILATYQAKSAVVVRLGGQVIAMLLLGGRQGLDHYGHDDLDLIEFLPGQLSLGFDRVHAYSQVCHGLGKAEKTASLMALMNEYQHELKAPISIMHMYTQAEVDAETLRSEVRLQCDRVLGLLEKMLRVLQDNRVREERPVDLNGIIESALRLLPVPDVDVKLDLQQQLPRLLGDADDLLILFVNLLKNAREASDPERRNIITISTRHLADLRSIQILVHDCGKGMPQERIRRLWLPLESGTPGGSGLGLKVMQRIVDEHGGEIRVTSTEGIGTRMEIRMPLAAANRGTV